jgi:surface polysaccharide O-acyltransferase-like enzyme
MPFSMKKIGCYMLHCLTKSANSCSLKLYVFSAIVLPVRIFYPAQQRTSPTANTSYFVIFISLLGAVYYFPLFCVFYHKDGQFNL